MSAVPLVPAELGFDGNSGAKDALAQARTSFLGGNDLLGETARWRGRDDFAILETGFGLGINFLATWQAWRDDSQRPRRLHFFSIEKHPFRRDDLARGHATLPELAPLAPLAEQLRSAWPSLVGGFHRLHFEDGAVTLTVIFGDVHTVVPAIGGRFDAFYLNDFSPTKHPEMWSASLSEDLAWLSAPTEIPPPISRVAIIGGGIAGIACAERLAARGCAVTLFEQHQRLVEETSGNHQAILLPVLAVDETRLSRLNRVAFLYTLRRLGELAAAGHPVEWEQCGVVQIARDAEHAKKQAAIVSNQHLPEDFAQFIDAATATEIVGTRVAGDAWWFPSAGWLAPASFAHALLAAAGTRVDCRLGTHIAALAQQPDGWQLLDAQGKALWQGQTVVLAHAHGIRTLPQAAHLPLRCFRGQVSHLPESQLAGLPRSVVCREGYLAPPHKGIAGLGATFQRSHERLATVDDHAANLNRLTAMLPEWSGRFVPSELAGRVGLRPVSPDKLPMLGALPLPTCEPRPLAHVEWPRWPGLHVATGYGARGFVWAPLMAELLASQITDTPLPVELELAAAVDPARFTWKGTL